MIDPVSTDARTNDMLREPPFEDVSKYSEDQIVEWLVARIADVDFAYCSVDWVDGLLMRRRKVVLNNAL